MKKRKPRDPLSKSKLEMDKEFFKHLPSEIVMDIHSRLPVKSIVVCKCVCKSWLNLLGTREFAKLHLSRSVPGLVVHRMSAANARSYNIFEFKDDLDLDLEHHSLHYELVTKFSFPHDSKVLGSVNGLLLLSNLVYEHGFCHYICNPTTRDYIKVHFPKELVRSKPHTVTCGFGASRVTGQSKVVMIFTYYISDKQTHSRRVAKSECYVYTLGIGSWRSIGLGVPLDYGACSNGAFVNGNVHWLVRDLNGSQMISCLDLETELFSTFPCPVPHGSKGFGGRLSVLGDCLCISEITVDGMVIWLVKEYGEVEKSWTQEFVISMFNGEVCSIFHPIKVFKDGDILMAPFMFSYSTKTKATQEIGIFEEGLLDAIIHTPSFVSLRSFGIETETWPISDDRKGKALDIKPKRNRYHRRCRS